MQVLLVGSDTGRAAWIMSSLAEPSLEITWDGAVKPEDGGHFGSYDLILVDTADRAIAETVPGWVGLGIPVIVLIEETEAVYPFFSFGVADVLPVPCVHARDLRARINARLADRTGREKLKNRLVQMETMLRAARTGHVIDPVTGCQTKSRIVESLSFEFSRAERYGAMLAIMFVKIGNLDVVRGNGGFLIADGMLGDIAGVLKGLLRETDVVGRYDDMFLALCPHTRVQDASVPAKRLIEAVAARPPGEWGEWEHPRVSIGIAGVPLYGIRTLEGLVQAADLALSDAERTGGLSVYGRSMLGEVGV